MASPIIAVRRMSAERNRGWHIPPPKRDRRIQQQCYGARLWTPPRSLSLQPDSEEISWKFSAGILQRRSLQERFGLR